MRPTTESSDQIRVIRLPQTFPSLSERLSLAATLSPSLPPSNRSSHSIPPADLHSAADDHRVNSFLLEVNKLNNIGVDEYEIQRFSWHTAALVVVI